MMVTVNLGEKLALKLTCDGCGKDLGVAEKYSLDLLNYARERGWYWVGYETPYDAYQYTTCHYCCEACQKKWEENNKKAKKK